MGALDTGDTNPNLPSAPKRWLGAIGTLRLLLAGTIAAPLLLGGIAAWISYRDTRDRAAFALTEAVAVAEENTNKVLDTHLLVAARIDDMLAGLGDEQIAGQEMQLHDRIARQIAELPQVAAAWVIDAAGHEVVSARVYPVDRRVDHARRDDFVALRDGRVPTFIWALRARSLAGGDFQPFFTVSRRRQAPDGKFAGIVVVAVSGNYFASFYDSLLDTPIHYDAAVLREDGTVLAHYPAASAPSAPQQPDPLLAPALAGKSRGGIVAGGTAADGSGRLVAYRRLATYPIYVTMERSETSLREEWLRDITGYIVVGVPAAIALIVLSGLALRRTRREQSALAQARDAVAQRAAIEVQLQEAQKLEAVGLLTAGIAHDFNNLITIVSGNIALLQSAQDGLDARRRRYLAAAASGCDRAAALTQRLLRFARTEPMDPRPLDVNEVITHTLELPWRTGDRVTREFRLADGLWPVLADPDQLEATLLNLALNARDAMAANGGMLTITTVNCAHDDPQLADAGAPPGDHVAILVSDTGAGMPPEVRDKAFEPFFTTKAPGKGTGLGLSQVYGFVTRSGGGCAIDSEPGRGTTVKLYLPRHVGGPAPGGLSANGFDRFSEHGSALAEEAGGADRGGRA